MYFTSIVTKIRQTLDTVTQIKAVYNRPENGAFKTTPVVVFTQDQTDNAESDSASNLKTFRFKMWVIVDAPENKLDDVFATILPNAVDAVYKAFDENWSHQIDNHRAWMIIDSGQWGYSVENKGKLAWAELRLTYKVSSDI